MTPSPEERANDIAGLIMLAGACDWGDGGRDVAVDLIASAIRDAESAALERAEREVRFAHLGMPTFIDTQRPWITALTTAADRVAALKHKD